MAKSINREVKVLKNNKHPNILGCYGIDIDKESFTINIFTELAEKGDVRGLLKKLSKKK